MRLYPSTETKLKQCDANPFRSHGPAEVDTRLTRNAAEMNADLILVMEAGKVIEQGTHNELLKKSGGKYANLVQQQLAVEDKKDDTSTDPKAPLIGAPRAPCVGVVGTMKIHEVRNTKTFH
eukprot:Skav223664  [mRNA]  locus=scaffold2794:56154:56721:+ [translate_table: standard]